MKSYKPHCRNCDEEYATDRWKLGYKHCMPCGEKLSHLKSKMTEMKKIDLDFWKVVE